MSTTRLAQLAHVTLVGLIWLAPVAAHAGAELSTVDGSGGVKELSHSTAITVNAAVAEVKVTQSLVNTGKQVAQAIYRFDLPAEAAIVDLSVSLPDGSRTQTVAIDSVQARRYPDNLTTLPTDAAPDIGLMRLVRRAEYSDKTVATYELHLYPLPPGKAVVVRTHWLAPVHLGDGRATFRVPARGNATNLVAETFKLRVRSPFSGCTLHSLHANGNLLAKKVGRKLRTFRVAGQLGRDLVVEARAHFAKSSTSKKMHVEASFAAVPLADDQGVLAVSLRAAPPRGGARLAYERMILVVDVSRSMGQAGLAAARRVATKLLGELPETSEIELFTFDREVTGHLGGFVANSQEAEARVFKALTRPELRNGSDLGLAVEQVGQLIEDSPEPRLRAEVARGERAQNLVVLISDGIAPSDLDGTALIHRMGSEARGSSEIAAITLVPEGAASPEPGDGAIGDWVGRADGRSLVMRHREVAARLPDLATAIVSPRPWEGFNLLDQRGAAIEADSMRLPASLGAGEGSLILVHYAGPAPRNVTIEADAGSETVKIAAKREQSKTIKRGAVALWAVENDAYSTGTTGDQLGQHSVVTSAVSLVVLDRKDEFARDRIKLAKKWRGAFYYRVPPPPELAMRHQFDEYDYATLADRPSTAPRVMTIAPSGELDRDIVKDLIERHVLHRAKGCYDGQLKRNHQLKGSMVLVVEMARGELQWADTAKSTFADAVVDNCVREAAYSIRVPRVALGSSPEQAILANYPLRFRRRGQSGTVEHGDDTDADEAVIEAVGEIDIDLDALDTPLGGLKRSDK